MTRETRIALLVGLVFIVLFGLVLGQRSLSLSTTSHPVGDASDTPAAPSRPGPEVVTGPMFDQGDQPILAADQQPPAEVAVGEHDETTPAVPSSDAQPASAQRTPPLPRPTAPPVRTYRVQHGDTLIGIARKVYGRGYENQHLRIYRANRDKMSNPAALSVGQVLVIPPASLAASAAESRRLASGSRERKHYTEMTLEALGGRFSRNRTYTVRSGDCLTSIARRTMGSGSRATVRKLIEANRGRISNPNRLTVGMKLNIPG